MKQILPLDQILQGETCLLLPVRVEARRTTNDQFVIGEGCHHVWRSSLELLNLTAEVEREAPLPDAATYRATVEQTCAGNAYVELPEKNELNKFAGYECEITVKPIRRIE